MIKFRNILGAATIAVSLFATSSMAAPYSISHIGNQSASSIAGITTGQTYQLTLVFDNGGTTANSQTWVGSTLQCVIWKFNNARDVVYTQDAATNAFSTTDGSATTNASGVLQTNFTEVNDDPAGGAGSTLTGASFTTDYWYANDNNGIFGTSSGSLDDAAGGVLMAAAGWTNPVPFSGNCAGRVLGTPVVAAVPTMPEWAMILFGLTLAFGAAIVVERRRTSI